MTPAQLATLKTDATANFAALVAAKDWPAVAAAYNLPSSPAVTIWRADIRPVEVIDAITGSEFIVLTAQHQAMLSLLLLPGVVDATSANVRADFSAIFSAGSSLTALIAMAQRTATRLEALFTTSAISAVYGHTLTADDVQKAMA